MDYTDPRKPRKAGFLSVYDTFGLWPPPQNPWIDLPPWQQVGGPIKAPDFDDRFFRSPVRPPQL